LRLTIDSLEPTDDDLLALLGNLRYRLEPRLKKCGIELDWQVQDVPKLACLDPKNVLHILRILQEGFTNILKHAHASMLQYARVSPSSISSSSPTTVVASRPVIARSRVRNMHRRAQALGASSRSRLAMGTALTLHLPVPSEGSSTTFGLRRVTTDSRDGNALAGYCGRDLFSLALQ
jgi:glucose-6-phosphate-specific signal transduction histidine kinase